MGSWVQTYAWVLRNLFEYLLRIVFSQSTLAQTKQKNNRDWSNFTREQELTPQWANGSA